MFTQIKYNVLKLEKMHYKYFLFCIFAKKLDHYNAFLTDAILCCSENFRFSFI